MFYSSYISNNRKEKKNTLSIHKKNRLELIVENSAKNILGCFCLLACLSVCFLEIVYKNKKNSKQV